MFLLFAPQRCNVGLLVKEHFFVRRGAKLLKQYNMKGVVGKINIEIQKATSVAKHLSFVRLIRDDWFEIHLVLLHNIR